MGTNYYLMKSAACSACGHAPEPIHIGKSSGGWTFSLHVYPGNSDLPQNFNDWKNLIEVYPITNEYGASISSEEMIETITDRKWKAAPRDAWFLHANQAVDGPNGLLRSIVDGRHCIAHGEGTYDYIVGDFS